MKMTKKEILIMLANYCESQIQKIESREQTKGAASNSIGAYVLGVASMIKVYGNTDLYMFAVMVSNQYFEIIHSGPNASDKASEQLDALFESYL